MICCMHSIHCQFDFFNYIGIICASPETRGAAEFTRGLKPRSRTLAVESGTIAGTCLARCLEHFRAGIDFSPPSFSEATRTAIESVSRIAASMRVLFRL